MRVFTSLFASIAIISSPLSAQELPPEVRTYLTQKLSELPQTGAVTAALKGINQGAPKLSNADKADGFFKATGLNPSSVLYRNLISGVERKPAPTSEPAEIKVISHFRDLEGGMALPLVQAAPPKPSNHAPSLPEALQKLVQSGVIEIEKYDGGSDPQRAPRLPLCQESKSWRARAPKLQKAGAEELISDMLILNQEPPSNPESAFGEGVLAVRYRGGEVDLMSLAIKDMGIPCLPYRVRVTNQNVRHYAGAAALENLDIKENKLRLKRLEVRR